MLMISEIATDGVCSDDEDKHMFGVTFSPSAGVSLDASLAKSDDAQDPIAEATIAVSLFHVSPRRDLISLFDRNTTPLSTRSASPSVPSLRTRPPRPPRPRRQPRLLPLRSPRLPPWLRPRRWPSRLRPRSLSSRPLPPLLPLPPRSWSLALRLAPPLRRRLPLCSSCVITSAVTVATAAATSKGRAF